MNAPAATPEVASRVVRVAEPSVLFVTPYRPPPARYSTAGAKAPCAQVAQDADLTGDLVGDDDVRGTVLIDIGQGHVRDAEADRQSHRGREEGVAGRLAPGTVAEKDREGAVARVAHHQVVPAVAVEVGRDDLRRERTGGERPDPDEVAVAPGVQRDRVVGGVHAGEHGALVRVHGDDVPRGVAGIDRDGRIEGAGLLRPSLSPEDVPGPIDHHHIVSAVAAQVRHERGGVGVDCERAGGSERPVEAQQHRHVVGVDSWRRPGRCGRRR